MKSKESDTFLDGIGSLIWVVISIIALAFMWVLTLVFKPFRPALSKYLRLKQFSRYWPNLDWLLRPIQVVAGIVCFVIVSATAYKIGTDNFRWEEMISAIPAFLLAAGCGLFLTIVMWIERYAADPDVQRELAGERAEKSVAACIDALKGRFKEARTLHGALLVFNPGQTNEYSVEIDHVLVTQHNVFVIETKYKSGRIVIDANDPVWSVSRRGITDKMRNALLQVKNTVRVIRRELGLEITAIPLVVIVGETELVGEVGNVITEAKLENTILAFEQAAQKDGRAPVPAEDLIAALSALTVSKAGPEMQRHRDRAERAKQKAELERIVETASIE